MRLLVSLVLGVLFLGLMWAVATMVFHVDLRAECARLMGMKPSTSEGEPASPTEPETEPETESAAAS